MLAVKPYFDEGRFEQQSYQEPRQFLDRHTMPNMLAQIYSESLYGWGVTKGTVQPGRNYVYPAWLIHNSPPSHPSSIIDQVNSGPEGNTMEYRKSFESAYQQCPKVNKEVSAFGLSHAEHARKLYLSRANCFKHESLHCTIPQYRQTMGHNHCLFLHHKKQAQTSSNGGLSLCRKAGRYDRIKLRAPSAPEFEPDGPILKRATISTRPPLKRLKAQGTSWQLRSHKYITALEKKESNLLESETKDNQSATAFQILCEISKTC